MLTLFTLLALLFLTLAILLPLLERYLPRPSADKARRFDRWIATLAGLAIVLFILQYWLGNP